MGELMEEVSCSCDKCISLCKRRPGWFAPGEAEKVAEFMELSFEELFRNYLIVDYWASVEASENIYLLSPASNEDPAGKIMDFNIFSPRECIFLNENNRCSIHSVKPLECKNALGCKDQDSYHEKIALLWKDQKKEQEKILALVDGEKREPNFDDMLEAMMHSYGMLT